MQRSRMVNTRVGWLWFVMGEKGLVRCTLPFSSKDAAATALEREFPDAGPERTLEPDLTRSLRDYFAGKSAVFSVKLDESSLTEFQRIVYRKLRRVKPGRTVTYGELAERAGRPRAARGVGVCMRKNPFPPVVPCHRVLGSSGALTGFSAEGGLELKRTMLEMEGLEGLK